MAITYAVNWDNGSEACGTFPYRFDTEAEAQEWADNWMNERNSEDLGLTPEQVEECGGEDCYTAEVIELDEPPEPDDEELLKREPWE
jgi:hypothetical protein